jgi:eukaryotic-like serine/threonine-protein kinase
LLETYVMAGMTTQAVTVAQERLNMIRGTLPPDSSQLAGHLAAAALALLRVQAWDEAEASIRESLAIRERHEPDVWTTFNARSMLGAALAGQRKYAEAEPLLLQGYEGMKQREDQIPAEGQVRLVEALERLVQLHEALEQPDQAAPWRSELEATKQRMASAAN